jgi:hypothetical protein
MKKIKVYLLSLTVALILSSCYSTNDINSNNKKIDKMEIYLPKLQNTYNSVYEHWNELNLDKITLMDKPFIYSGDIEYIDYQSIKTKKNFIIVNGTGLESNSINDDKKDCILKFQYEGKEYNIDKDSPELFYNYTIYDICVVVKDDNVFLVKQVDFIKDIKNGEDIKSGRKYNKGIIGIPYILVVNGEKREIGVLKVDDAEFAVPSDFDSWCYMGVPDGLINRIPYGSTLKKEE